MKELEINAVNNLIKVYEHYLEGGLSRELTESAKRVYDEYHPAHTLLDKNINKAVGNLFPLAYPNSKSGIKSPTKEEVEQTIYTLKKRKQELEK